MNEIKTKHFFINEDSVCLNNNIFLNSELLIYSNQAIQVFGSTLSARPKTLYSAHFQSLLLYIFWIDYLFKFDWIIHWRTKSHTLISSPCRSDINIDSMSSKIRLEKINGRRADMKYCLAGLRKTKMPATNWSVRRLLLAEIVFYIADYPELSC